MNNEVPSRKRFEKTPEETILDNQTGLEWLVWRDEPTNLYDAYGWISSLGDGWRLPSLEELKGIRQDSKERGLYLSQTFDVGKDAWWVWSNEICGEKNRVCGFYMAGSPCKNILLYSNIRAFCVRRKK